MQIVINTTDVQDIALSKLGITGDSVSTLLLQAAQNTIKGKFMYAMKKAEADLGPSYDAAIKMGFKISEDRGAFIKRNLADYKAISDLFEASKTEQEKEEEQAEK